MSKLFLIKLIFSSPKLIINRVLIFSYWRVLKELSFLLISFLLISELDVRVNSPVWYRTFMVTQMNVLTRRSRHPPGNLKRTNRMKRKKNGRPLNPICRTAIPVSLLHYQQTATTTKAFTIWSGNKDRILLLASNKQLPQNFYKKVFLKILQISHEETCVGASF